MSVYAITFRISSESHSTLGTYQERYDSVNDAIKLHANIVNYWAETTSFFLIESSQVTASALLAAIDRNSKFARTLDLLVVIDLSNDSYELLGKNADDDIVKIMKLR